MKKLIKLMLLFSALIVLGACTGEAGSQGSEDGFKVGFSMSNMNDTFLTYVLNASEDTASEYGIDMRVENAEEDLIRQQDQVNALIQNDVDGLIVIPVDTSAVKPITDAAQEAEIPLIYLNRNPYTDEEVPEGVYVVSSDEITAGQMQMEYIGEEMNGEGGIGILMGILGSEAAVQRTAGVKEVVAESYPDIDILSEETAEWQRDQAVSIAENWITTYGENIDAILSNNDEMALGALQAVKNTGRDDMYIMGVDATDDALAAVEAGELTGTVFQDAEGQGSTAIEVMNDLFHGIEPEEQVINIPFELVTEENVEEFY